MAEEHFKKLKEALHKINSDPSLTEEQKAKLRQELFSHPSTQKPQVSESKDESMEPSYQDAEKTIFGCSHYKRDAKIVAKCCGKVFTCRFCHDEACDHKIVRFEIEEMICMHCKVRQPIQQFCHSSICGERKLATYYCSICKFLDNSNRAIYHCPGCGICRVGKGLGIDFFHCNGCNLCFPLNGGHQCPKVDVRDRVCPVCLEDLFHSRDRVHPLRCSHFMHLKCYEQHRSSSSLAVCPICSKSIDPPPTIQRINNSTPGNDSNLGTRTEERDNESQMRQTGQNETSLDQEQMEVSSENHTTSETQNQDPATGPRGNNVTRIVVPRRDMNPEYLEMFLARSLPMPQEYRHIKAKVLCNDCLEHTITSYHFYGSWCDHCGSWNTRLVSTEPPLASLSSDTRNPALVDRRTEEAPPVSPNSPLASQSSQDIPASNSVVRSNQPSAQNNIIQLVLSDNGRATELHLEIAYENGSDTQLENLPSLSVAQLVEGYLGDRPSDDEGVGEGEEEDESEDESEDEDEGEGEDEDDEEKDETGSDILEESEVGTQGRGDRSDSVDQTD